MTKFLLLTLTTLSFSLAHADLLKVGDTAPCTEINQLLPDGQETVKCVLDTDVKGQYAMLEFFSATCEACDYNLPLLTDLAAEFANTTTTRLIGIDRNEKLMRDYVAANRDLIKIPVALDAKREAKAAFGIYATPTTFILGPNKKVLYVHVGTFEDADFAEIRAILSKTR